MKQCPFCEKEVPDDTVVCPHCGRDQWTAHIPLAMAAGLRGLQPKATSKPKPGFLRSKRALLLLAVIVVLSALGFCGYGFRP
jgi:hypothetical protein